MVEYTQLGFLLKDRMFFVVCMLIRIDRCLRKTGFWECRIQQRDSMYVSLHAHSQDYSDCEQDGLPSCSTRKIQLVMRSASNLRECRRWTQCCGHLADKVTI